MPITLHLSTDPTRKRSCLGSQSILSGNCCGAVYVILSGAMLDLAVVKGTVPVLHVLAELLKLGFSSCTLRLLASRSFGAAKMQVLMSLCGMVSWCCVQGRQRERVRQLPACSWAAGLTSLHRAPPLQKAAEATPASFASFTGSKVIATSLSNQSQAYKIPQCYIAAYGDSSFICDASTIRV
jgi:hypothetical protein